MIIFKCISYIEEIKWDGIDWKGANDGLW